MIYSMLFMSEGHTQIGMSSISAGGVAPGTRAAGREWDKENTRYDKAMTSTLDGLLPPNSGL